MRRVFVASVLAALADVGMLGESARAQDLTAPSPTAAASTAARSDDGRLLVLAVRAGRPVDVDGSLDDEAWGRATAVGGFVQSEPHEGEPATERTDVRVVFDDDTLYIGAYCHDSQPDAAVVNDIRKDFKAGDQDSFEVIIDTFGDRRNGYVFMTNPAGARSDEQVANEGRETNASWDAVWRVETRAVSDGWIAEMAIPFRALRFERGSGRVWGMNFSRRIRRKNEIDFWSPVPRAFNLSRVSLAGNVAGVDSGAGGRDLRMKPYVLGSSLRGLGASSSEASGDAGVDLKYGVSAGLTLDVTARPDFAQVEADEQQVNLTQFSQFFPEKREFFLENSGMFYVGDTARNNRVNPTPTPDEDLLLFFSRRIGLSADGTVVPLFGGARLTGQAGGFGIGALSIQSRATAATPSNNYTVVRARRNLLRNSDIGGVFMNRQASGRANDYNRVFGGDATFRLFGSTDWNTYVIRTVTPGIRSGQYAWRSTLNYEGRFAHAKGGLLSIGDGFNNDLGYYRRTGIRKWMLDTGIRPRPQRLQRYGIREVHPHVVWGYYTDQSGWLTAKNQHNGLTTFFNNGGYAEFSLNQKFQLLTAPFTIHTGSAPIAAGRYGWNEYQGKFSSDPSRALVLNVTYINGGLWSGTQQTVNATVGLRLSYRFQMNIGAQRTSASLATPAGAFAADLWTMRANYSVSRDMFVDALLQYSRDQRQMSTNVRFNFIHHPLSDFFIVYNEQRLTTAEAPPSGRGVVVKFTQMLAF